MRLLENKILDKNEGILSAIGFSNVPVCQENYLIGKTNRCEWALMQNGLIIENDDFKNDIFHYEVKFNVGDIIRFTYYDKHINFFINLSIASQKQIQLIAHYGNMMKAILLKPEIKSFNSSSNSESIAE